MQGRIPLTLPDLTPEQAIEILQFYIRLTGRAPADTAPAAAAPHGAPVAQQPVAAAAEIAPPAVSAAPPAAAADGAYDPALATPSDAYDFHGVPWCEAVHSRRDGPTKGRNAQGGWKMRKNVNKQDFDDWNRRHHGSGPRTPAAQGHIEAPSPQPPAQAAVAPQWGRSVTEDEFMALAGRLGAAGKITTQVVAEVLKITGKRNQTEVTQDPASRLTAYDYLQTLAA